MCPKLDTLVLTNNRLSKLSDVDDIATCKTLKRLTLIGNMVVNLQNYRLYTIHKIPSLRALDFQNITQKEREQAEQLFTSKDDGQEEIQTLSNTNPDKTEEVEKQNPVEEMQQTKNEECKSEKV